MSTDFRALLENLVEEVLDANQYIPPGVQSSITRANAALAEPKPERPTYDDLAELCSEHGLDVDSWPLEKFDALWETVRAVLARWCQPS